MTAKVEQIYTNCLAHGAYYIESQGEAAIIDPLREVQPYVDLAASRGTRIKYVLETHFHADFVSGHVDLARQTGAQIIYGPTNIEIGFDAVIARDGQEFALGDYRIRLLHTPGHTMESSCYLLIDDQDQPTALFTGDTLFIGDVGRPDLAQKVDESLTQEKLASLLYDSLRQQIMPLADDIIVYPGHGAGSACGKKMSEATSDTLGNQKLSNYALDPGLDRDSFVQAVLNGLTPPPGYFPQNVLLNIAGSDTIDEVLARGTTPLDVHQFRDRMSTDDVAVLDTRNSLEFAEGFIPGSINIGLVGKFAHWVGVIFRNVKQPLLLVTEPGKETETVTRLARIGFDNALGFLDGGVNAWAASGFELDRVESISAEQLSDQMDAGLLSDVPILDVRKASEFDSEHVVGAVNTPLDSWRDQESILVNQKQFVLCQSGYRSMAFVSLMRKRGHKNLVNVVGGMQALKEFGRIQLTDYVCPSTML